MKIIKKLLLLIVLIFPFYVKALELPDLHSRNIILYDPDNNKILYEKNSTEIVNIASLTKIMTTIVAIENIDDLDEYVTITQEMLAEVPWDASVAGLKVGDKVTYRDLLYASMLPSGADATTALAYGICGSSEKFVELMNAKAKKLGLVNTNFVNVTGYDIPNHYSTSKEVLTYLLYSLKNDLFREIYTTKSYTLTNGLLVLSSSERYSNKGNYDLSHVLGSKTGYTDNAGLCISALIDINDKELILLTLGAEVNPGRTYHIEDTVTVINYLLDNYKKETIYKKGDVLFTIPVILSNIDSYDVTVNKDIDIFTDNLDKEEYKYEFKGLDKLSYKNKKGDKIGTIRYYYQDDVTIEDVYLNEDINISYLKLFKSNPTLLIPFIIVFILIIVAIMIRPKKRKRKKSNK